MKRKGPRLMIDLVLYDFYGVSLGCRLGVTECDGTWLMVGTLLGDGEGFGDSVGRDCGGTLVGASDSEGTELGGWVFSKTIRLSSGDLFPKANSKNVLNELMLSDSASIRMSFASEIGAEASLR